MNAQPLVKKRTFRFSVSLRTLLLLAASLTSCLLVLTVTQTVIPAVAIKVLEPVTSLTLLGTMMFTFASIADDLYGDPGVTFISGLFGFLGYFLLHVVAMIFNATVG